LRRLIKPVAAGRTVGHTTTLTDAGVMASIAENVAAGAED
jgi:hypothetical protein